MKKFYRVITVFAVLLAQPLYGRIDDCHTSLSKNTSAVVTIPEVPYGDLKPNTPEFESFARQVMSADSLHELPYLNVLKIKEQFGTGVGRLGNQLVYFKRGGAPDILYEAQMYLLLNRLGIGAKLVGVVRNDGVMMDLVTAFEPGKLIKAQHLETVYSSYVIRETHYSSVQSAVMLLQESGFTSAFDLQFILSPHGKAVLIDPALFQFRDYPSITKRFEATEVIGATLLEAMDNVLSGREPEWGRL